MSGVFENCKYCGEEIRRINATHDLVECGNCELIFSRKKFSQQEFQEIYDKLYNDDNPKYRSHSILEYEQMKQGIVKVGYNRSRLVRKYVRNDSDVLEIGSGIGLMGCFIKKTFPNNSFTGVEIDEKVNEKARSFGLDVHQGDFSIIKDVDRQFDVVLMWEVLEHIQDMKKCLTLIKDKLKPGGLFIFSVPNYDKRLNYKAPGDNIFQDGPPIHLNFFSKRAVQKIFKSEDFEILSLEKKKLPYFNFSSLSTHFLKVLIGKYEGPTLFCVLRKK